MENIFGLKENEELRVAVRSLRETDLAHADRIMRLAFGTYLGLPDPASFLGEGDYVYTRWKNDPDAAFCAGVNGRIAGSAFATNWGSVGFFGPLTTHPQLWDKGVAKKLLAPIMECFDRWQTKNAGLFTFAASAKHVGLYQKFGFWPQYLTAIMVKPVAASETHVSSSGFSTLSEEQKKDTLRDARNLTDKIHEGLVVNSEILSVANQKLGETVLLREGSALTGLAVCHYGPGTEASAGACYVKFGAAASSRQFDLLLAAVEQLAVQKGLGRVVAGMNTARYYAYTKMLQRGYKTSSQGVVMQRPNRAGYNHPGSFIIDDWR